MYINCEKCSCPIREEVLVGAVGGGKQHFLHLKCMKCKECKVRLKHKAFYLQNDYYCKLHYYSIVSRIHPSRKVCFGCGYDIIMDQTHNSEIKLDFFKYHPECFVCHICKAPIAVTAPVTSVMGKLYCSAHTHLTEQQEGEVSSDEGIPAKEEAGHKHRDACSDGDALEKMSGKTGQHVRGRTIFTKAQLKRLHEVFNKDHTPPHWVYRQLQKELNLKTEIIRNWFLRQRRQGRAVKKRGGKIFAESSPLAASPQLRTIAPAPYKGVGEGVYDSLEQSPGLLSGTASMQVKKEVSGTLGSTGKTTPMAYPAAMGRATDSVGEVASGMRAGDDGMRGAFGSMGVGDGGMRGAVDPGKGCMGGAVGGMGVGTGGMGGVVSGMRAGDGGMRGAFGSMGVGAGGMRGAVGAGDGYMGGGVGGMAVGACGMGRVVRGIGGVVGAFGSAAGGPSYTESREPFSTGSGEAYGYGGYQVQFFNHCYSGAQGVPNTTPLQSGSGALFSSYALQGNEIMGNGNGPAVQQGGDSHVQSLANTVGMSAGGIFGTAAVHQDQAGSSYYYHYL